MNDISVLVVQQEEDNRERQRERESGAVGNQSQH